MFLRFNGPDKSEAVSIAENLLDKSPDPILLLNTVRATLLNGECVLQVLLRRDGIIECVCESQCEVPDDPHE